ncbi:hypothetical protein [Streptomyces sp900116325]|uniref:hypothetical protein n=1 Tax=Streptomyces sp. 900116325 TaxID=3154295 RepID=UPI00332D0E3D
MKTALAPAVSWGVRHSVTISLWSAPLVSALPVQRVSSWRTNTTRLSRLPSVAKPQPWQRFVSGRERR